VSALAVRRLFIDKSPAFARLSEVGGTGLEPVTPSLSTRSGRSRPFARVRSTCMVERNPVDERTPERTRANAERCHCCHAVSVDTGPLVGGDASIAAWHPCPPLDGAQAGQDHISSTGARAGPCSPHIPRPRKPGGTPAYTPEVAGSSPVAPAKAPANRHLRCPLGRNRPPTSRIPRTSRRKRRTKRARAPLAGDHLGDIPRTSRLVIRPFAFAPQEWTRQGSGGASSRRGSTSARERFSPREFYALRR
jgi:hypothetical protein